MPDMNPLTIGIDDWPLTIVFLRIGVLRVCGQMYELQGPFFSPVDLAGDLQIMGGSHQRI